MIERTKFIESVETWYESPLAMPSDVLLCAFVSLRRLTSDVFELLESHRAAGFKHQPLHLGSLLRLFTTQISTWQSRWVGIGEKGTLFIPRSDTYLTIAIVGCQPCNIFMIQFYGLHLRLLLSSFSLQPSSTSPEGLLRVEGIWSGHTAAMEMLRLVSKPEVSPLLYFAQDSVHVMTAYAAVFLVKVSTNSFYVLRYSYVFGMIFADPRMHSLSYCYVYQKTFKQSLQSLRLMSSAMQLYPLRSWQLR
jgi:hypothetical protein